jgi:hypothetical protein
MIEDRWHSCIRVRLELPEPLQLKFVRSFLVADGYESASDGEVFHLSRPDRVEPWQVESIVNVHLWSKQQELYFVPPIDDVCTDIELTYLLPWLPIEHAATFVSAVFRCAERFATSATLQGTNCTRQSLIDAIHGFAADLERRLEAPGGQHLAIAIDQKLPL